MRVYVHTVMHASVQPCSCLPAFYSPNANHSGHAASIFLTALGDWEKVWELCFGHFGGGGRNEYNLTMSVRVPE